MSITFHFLHMFVVVVMFILCAASSNITTLPLWALQLRKRALYRLVLTVEAKYV
jgi:hypothetical protein